MTKKAKCSGNKLRLTVTVPLELPNSDSCFTELVANMGLSPEKAKSILATEAYFRNGQRGPEFPVSVQLIELCDEQNVFELLEIFYGIYYSQSLPDEVDFKSEEIITAFEAAIACSGLAELLKSPDIILKFLPENGVTLEVSETRQVHKSMYKVTDEEEMTEGLVKTFNTDRLAETIAQIIRNSGFEEKTI